MYAEQFQIKGATGGFIANVNALGELLVSASLTPSGTQNVDIVGNTIGLSTSANQTLELTQLGNILTAINTLLKPSNTLAAVTSITNPVTVNSTNLDIRDLAFATDKADVSGSSVSVSNFPALQPVSGPLTNAELRATPVPVTATFTPSGTQDVNLVSSAIALATSALQTSANLLLTSIDTKLTSPLAVTGPLTDAELRASAVPVSVASVPLPTGASTEAKQDTEITALGTLNTSVNTLLKPADTLTKVTTVDTITNPVAVTGPLTDAELRATPVPVSVATVPLPAGAATETKQDTQITELQDIEADVEAMSLKLPATLGQKPMATSMAVAIASDQTWTGATNLGKAEDAPHASGDVGVAMLGVRRDSAVLPNTDGDYGVPSLDQMGKLIVQPYSARALRIHNSIVLTTTAETQVIPGAVGLYSDVANIHIANQGAGNDVVTIRSGVAGTILLVVPTIAGDSHSVTLMVPIPAPLVGQPITAQLSAASATGVRVSITAVLEA